MNFILFIINVVFFGFVSILILSVGVVVCTAPMGLFAKLEKPSRFLTAPFIGIAAIYQIYFWGLWSAFCVATIISFTNRPEVTWDWFYWITGFFCCLAPIGWLSQKERQTSQSRTGLRGIEIGTTLYSLIIAGTFIVFAFAPSLMLPPYSWALKSLGLAGQ